MLAVVEQLRKKNGAQAVFFPNQWAQGVSSSVRQNGIEQDDLIADTIQKLGGLARSLKLRRPCILHG